MDKEYGVESSTNCNNGGGGGGNRETYLKQVNKNSHKILKPFRKPIPAAVVSAASAAASVSISTSAALSVPISDTDTQPQSQQPPVYNINKNDFRNVVQKLTGSPSHERLPTPPASVTQPRLSSSRLQRIRPPPLAQICNRPPQLTQIVPRPPNDVAQRAALQSLTPLPPLPSVHPAAESPVSAYMRFLQGSAASSSPSPLWNVVTSSIGPRPESILPQNEVAQRAALVQPFSQLPSTDSPVSTYLRCLQSSANSSATPPRWNGVALPPSQPHLLPPQQHHPPLPSSSARAPPFPVLPLSPLPFGCIPSPRSPYGMLSPGLLYPPTGQLGLPQLPLSPTVPLPSPKWRTV